MAYNFDKEKTKVLITIYEKYPDIYNVHREIYKNKTNRQMKLTQILNEFKIYYPEADVTLLDIKRKINGLRSQFFAELAKVTKSITTGSGTDDVYRPSWWCFDLLKFLETSAVTRGSTSNFESSVSSNPVNENQEDASQQVLFSGSVEELENSDVYTSPITSPPSPSIPGPSELQKVQRKKRKTALSTSEQTRALLEEATMALKNQTSEGDPTDSLKAFTDMILAEMHTITNKSILMRLKRNMTKLLFDAVEEDQLENTAT